VIESIALAMYTVYPIINSLTVSLQHFCFLTPGPPTMTLSSFQSVL